MTKAHLNSHDDGFSLLEMLIVLAIMSLVISLAGLRTFNSVEAIRFDQAIKQIESDLKLQRAIAVVENRTYFFSNGINNGINVDTVNPNQTRFALTKLDTISISGDPIIIYSTGICSASELNVRSEEGRSSKVFIATETCQLIRSG